MPRAGTWLVIPLLLAALLTPLSIAAQTIRVEAAAQETPTGITVLRGEVVSFDAKGRWCWAAGEQACSDADGFRGRPNADERPVVHDGSWFGTLLARVGDIVIPIGLGGDVSMPSDGEIVFLFNDRTSPFYFQDNHGSLTVTVERRGEGARGFLRYKPHDARYDMTLEMITQDGTTGVMPAGTLAVAAKSDSGDGLLAEFVHDVEGEFTRTTLTAEELESGLMEGYVPEPRRMLFLPLPGEPRAVGLEWHSEINWAFDAARELVGDIPVSETTRYWIETIEGSRITLKFESQGAGKITFRQGTIGGIATVDMRRSGTTVFDAVAGRTISSVTTHSSTSRLNLLSDDGEREEVTLLNQFNLTISPG
jgi:hypothetical protein